MDIGSSISKIEFHLLEKDEKLKREKKEKKREKEIYLRLFDRVCGGVRNRLRFSLFPKQNQSTAFSDKEEKKTTNLEKEKRKREEKTKNPHPLKFKTEKIELKTKTRKK